MTERLCSWSEDDLNERGKPNELYRNLYEHWGKGGIGTIVLGNIPCDYRFPESRNNACLDPNSNWDHVALFKPVIAAAKAHGSIVIGQVTHAGRVSPIDLGMHTRS
jgi:2,4-dienoyl-CoA reductase-like NADH-dependent reductase (Old Yellow Enzyme family)